MTTLINQLTDDVAVDGGATKALIYLDGEVVGYADNEDKAMKYIDELADKSEKELSEEHGGNDWVQVFRENFERKIQISIKTRGHIYDGSVKLMHTFNVRSVSKYIERHRPPPPPPSPKSEDSDEEK